MNTANMRRIFCPAAKQRGIAGVIAMRPRCIVLDEPTAMLDPQGRREVLDTVMRLNRESGITVVITHHMREAALAQRVIAIKSDGGIIADGTPKGGSSVRSSCCGASG